MFRTAHRLSQPSLRSSARVGLKATACSPCVTLTRRMMSSGPHTGHGSTPNDKPWIIGSALVFGPLFLYFVSPSARKGSHEHKGHGHDEHVGKYGQPVGSHREDDVKPIADDEGTEVSGQEVKESIEKAFEADSPKDAQGREAVVVKTETTTVEETSGIETHLQEESSTDATPTESEPNSPPAGTDEAAKATGGEKVIASDANEPPVESRVE